MPTAMDGGSAENAWSNFMPTAMDGGSAENAWSNFMPTAMARIVPTILLHFLHPWRSDVGSAENAWSNFMPVHPWLFAAYRSFPEHKKRRPGLRTQTPFLTASGKKSN